MAWYFFLALEAPISVIRDLESGIEIINCEDVMLKHLTLNNAQSEIFGGWALCWRHLAYLDPSKGTP